MTLGSRQSSPRTFVGSGRTPRDILGDTVRLAAPTDEGAELPSQVPAIPCRGEPPPLREIGRQLARVARHPRRDRVATRQVRQLTLPVRTPISRGVAPDPPKVRPPPRQLRAGSQRRSPRTFFGSRRTPRNILGDTIWLAAPTEGGRARTLVGSRRTPRNILGDTVWLAARTQGGCARTSVGSRRTPRNILSDTVRLAARTDGGCARTSVGSTRIPRKILGDTVRLAARTDGGCARTLVGSRRTPRNILGDTVRLAAPTEEGAELPLGGDRRPPSSGAATHREINRRHARVTRHPRRDRVPTRPVRQPTSPVETPTPRGTPPDPLKGGASVRRVPRVPSRGSPGNRGRILTTSFGEVSLTS
jgi:hypothetical protein